MCCKVLRHESSMSKLFVYNGLKIKADNSLAQFPLHPPENNQNLLSITALVVPFFKFLINFFSEICISYLHVDVQLIIILSKF